MTSQAEFFAEYDAIINDVMRPVGMVDTGDWCSRSGAQKSGVTILVDRNVQNVGLEGAVSVGAIEIELLSDELGEIPQVGGEVRIGDERMKLMEVVSRDENRHRFAVKVIG